MYRFVLLMMLATIPGISRSDRHASSAADACFADIPGVTACLATPFKGYWEANGGLPVFGYPLTGTNLQQNADLNRALMTQWTERNRLEIHPENSSPYSLLLGRMGVERLQQLGRSGASEAAEDGPRSGCLWFALTKHNVCDQGNGTGFRSYWQHHGLQIASLDSYNRSLQLFGLPLTTPRPERNEAGDTVVTQWFERARFEWHPDKPDEFKVLLGLLGSELRRTNAPSTEPISGVQVSAGLATATAGQLQASHAALARYGTLKWSSVEVRPGDRTWANIQPMADELATIGRSGVPALVVVGSTPPWAQAVPGSACGPIKAAALDAFASFMHDLVQRFSGPPYNVHMWEIGNEPDVPTGALPGDSEFGCWADPTDAYYGGNRYGEMLKHVYPRIKEADPSAQVGIGGLLLDCDPTHPPAGKNCDPALFFEGILRAKADVAFDFVNYHAYSYWSPARQDWDLTSAAWQARGGSLLGKLDFLQGVLARYGVVKPIMMNEGGLLCYPGSHGCPGDGFATDQANYMLRLAARAWAHGLTGAVWYTLNGPGWRYGGLLDGAQQPLPAYRALVLLTTVLRGATFMGPVAVPGGEGYLFQKGTTTYTMLWTNSDTTATIVAPAGMTARYDVTSQRTPTTGQRVQVGFDPVIIEAQP